MDPILSLRDVARDFATRRRVIQAMAGVSLDVGAGEFLTIVGPSGCRKSTLLNIVSGLLPPPITSVLTVVGGRIVYAAAEFAGLDW